ncbi:MAG: flavodoxin family protein [Deltaproteobacteria bacterium]|nr:flavodoxin family protein [Deltaproteobacteria bacterium]
MPKVKILGISASPRKKGNSQFLLERALAAAEEAIPGGVESEMQSLAGKKISYCLSCFKCLEKGDCIIEDDFQALRDKWVGADAILYSVPVYHMGLPGQLKCFIDRLGNTIFVRYNGAPKFLKITGNIVQGAHIFAGQEQVLIALITHAILMGCLPVGGDPWQCYIGAGGWTRNGMATDSLSQLYEEGEEDAQAAVVGAESVGKRLAQTTLLIKSGGEACRDLLSQEETFGPFLSRLDS